MNPQALGAVCLVAAVLALIPLTWQYRNRSVPILSLGFWFSQAALFAGLRVLLWDSPLTDGLKVFCDITLFLRNAMLLGAFSCHLCLARLLYKIATQTARVSKIRGRYAFQVEIAVCLVFPLLFGALYYIHQPNRFNIVEDVGCISPMWFSWPALVLYYIPLLGGALAISTYGGLGIYAFLQNRIRFNEMLSQSPDNSVGLTTAQFLRLELVLIMFSLVSLTSTIFNVLFDFTSLTLKPYPSWDIVHHDFGKINYVSRASQSPIQNVANDASVVLLPATALLFFVFFGLGEEALKEYKRWWRWLGLSRRLGRRERRVRANSGPLTPSDEGLSQFSKV